MQLVRESPASSRRVGCANLMNIYQSAPLLNAARRERNRPFFLENRWSSRSGFLLWKRRYRIFQATSRWPLPFLISG